MSLQEPIAYFPVSAKPFEFKVGLKKLPAQTTDPAERIFQIDHQWPAYRAEKLAARGERLGKYVCEKDLSDAARSRVAAYLVKHLSTDFPEHFRLEVTPEHAVFDCRLSGERLVFDNEIRLVETENVQVDPGYIDALDALCCQIQEDLSISQTEAGHDKVTYLHLCLPNYWAAEAKIGKCFMGAHSGVPEMDRINAQSNNLVDTLARKGPFERFTWGLTTDTRLNHHPEAPAGEQQADWYGRRFSAEGPLYLRSERQVTVGFPDAGAYIFTIRTYYRDVNTLTAEQLVAMMNGIETMSPNILRYKGLAEHRQTILTQLKRLAAKASTGREP